MPDRSSSLDPANLLTSARRQWIRRRLLSWFDVNARDLPWRSDRDAYRIWVSEVMLQQTQVASVIPYFTRFLKQFPTLTALAQADEPQVLRFWEGLGYYRRARDLLRAAQLLHGQGHGTVPDDPELLRTLPGFGRYTANAVLSQGYERRLPILEANSQRVWCRFFGIEEDPKEGAVQKALWGIAETVLPTESVGHFNQAVMELGALVCAPTRPDCHICPLVRQCQAALRNCQEQIPRRAKSTATVGVEEVAVVIRRKDKILLIQRPADGRWANLWECPHQPVEWMTPHAVAAEALLADLGIKGKIVGEIATIRHSITRYRVTMVCLDVVYQRGAVRADRFPRSAWVGENDLDEFSLSSPQRRLVRRLRPGALSPFPERRM